MKIIIAQIKEDKTVISLNCKSDLKGKLLNEFYFGNNMIDSCIEQSEFNFFVNIATLNPMIPNITEVYYMAKYENEKDWKKAIYDLNNHSSIVLPEDEFKNIYQFKDGIWSITNS